MRLPRVRSTEWRSCARETLRMVALACVTSPVVYIVAWPLGYIVRAVVGEILVPTDDQYDAILANVAAGHYAGLLAVMAALYLWTRLCHKDPPVETDTGGL